MPQVSVVKLRLALMGRPVRNYAFDKPIVTVGRDPDSDVFVDNPGVSRDHFRLERTESGEYQVVDLGSANGTLLNDQKVNVAHLHNNDVVRFGKYTLWVGYDQDKPTESDDVRRQAADTERHTMVLSRAELDSVIESSKAKELDAQPTPVLGGSGAAPALAAPPASHTPVAALLVSFALGIALGAGFVWILLHR